eukprot:1496129-Rhodomonas_salina.1
MGCLCRPATDSDDFGVAGSPRRGRGGFWLPPTPITPTVSPTPKSCSLRSVSKGCKRAKREKNLAMHEEQGEDRDVLVSSSSRSSQSWLVIPGYPGTRVPIDQVLKLKLGDDGTREHVYPGTRVPAQGVTRRVSGFEVSAAVPGYNEA